MDPIEEPVLDDRDRDHLNILKICYYISAGLSAVGAVLASVIYIVLGGFMVSQVPDQEAHFVGGAFIGVGIFLFILMGIGAAASYFTGRRLAEQRGKIFVMIVAGLHCLSFPLGTILGVFTFVVLLRPAVQAVFDRHDHPVR